MVREGEARVGDGATDAFSALVDGAIAHADDAETGEAAGGVSFDGDGAALVAERYGRNGVTGVHGESKTYV